MLKLPWKRRHPVLPVLRLEGAIGSLPMRRGGLALRSLNETIERAFSFEQAPFVALAVSSPGGSPVQSALLAERIRALAEEKDKKVIAFVEDVAASGGYWIALAADEIFCNAASIIGSIGVVSAGFGFTDALGKLGIERRVHTAGAKKALLDPFRPESEEDLLLLRELQQDIYDIFKEYVRQRRGKVLKIDEDELFSGRVWTGRRAVELGLVDGLASLHDQARERLGDKVRVVTVNRPRSWLRRRLGMDHSAPISGGLDGAVTAMFAEIEERQLFRRYGL